MKDKKLVFSIFIIICVICSIFLLICNKKEPDPEWKINYEIENFAGMQENYGQYYQTFSVSGTVSIKNFDCKMIIITATAVGNLGGTIPIFTVVDINGDGTYNFNMDSFYGEGVEYVVKIIDIKVKKP